MITLRQLANALALSKYGSFRRAAEAQSLSQPAFSRSIQNLEAFLGVSLFDRQPHATTPTRYGEVMLRRAEHIQDEVDELRREIELLRGLEAGRFSVAMGVYPAELSCSRAMGELVRDHPDLRCEHIITNWRNVISLVSTRRVDLGVGEISVAKSDDLLQVELVGQHDLVLFCRPGHPLLGFEHVSESDIDAYPMAMVHLPPRVGKVFPGKCDVDPVTGDVSPSVEVEDLAAVRTIVSASNAFGMATPIQLEPWLRRTQYGVLAYRPPWMKLQYGFIYLRDRMLSPAAQAFMQLVREIETDLAPRNRKLMKQLYPASDKSQRV